MITAELVITACTFSYAINPYLLKITDFKKVTNTCFSFRSGAFLSGVSSLPCSTFPLTSTFPVKNMVHQYIWASHQHPLKRLLRENYTNTRWQICSLLNSAASHPVHKYKMHTDHSKDYGCISSATAFLHWFAKIANNHVHMLIPRQKLYVSCIIKHLQFITHMLIISSCKFYYYCFKIQEQTSRSKVPLAVGSCKRSLSVGGSGPMPSEDGWFRP